jgi:hypothetical protein
MPPTLLYLSTLQAQQLFGPIMGPGGSVIMALIERMWCRPKLVRSRVVPHPRDINDLISGEGLKVALRRKGNFRQLPHLTLLFYGESGIMSALCQKQTFAEIASRFLAYDGMMTSAPVRNIRR